jgi:hypothetical protein
MSEQERRREFLFGLGKWSKIVIGSVIGAAIVTAGEAEAGWLNNRGYGGAGWINGGGGGGWINRRGGGGWLNAR